MPERGRTHGSARTTPPLPCCFPLAKMAFPNFVNHSRGRTLSARRRRFYKRTRKERPMKMTIEVECTPTEARQFLGLPDVTRLNEALVDEMTRRMQTNMAMMA